MTGCRPDQPTLLEGPAAALSGRRDPCQWSARDKADQAGFEGLMTASESAAGTRRETPRRAQVRSNSDARQKCA